MKAICTQAVSNIKEGDIVEILGGIDDCYTVQTSRIELLSKEYFEIVEGEE